MEDDVENLVLAVLDMPMAAHCGGEQLGVEWHGRQVATPFQAGAAVALHLGFDNGDGAQAWEARLAGETTCGGQNLHG